MGKFPLGIGAALLSALFSATAAARPVTVEIGDVSRKLPHGNLAPTQINYADCLADDTLNMGVYLGPDFLGYGLEIWAGTGCEGASNRLSATGTCWLLQSGSPTSIVNRAEIPVRDLLRGRTHAVDADGGADPSELAACEPANSADVPQPLSVYAMLVDGSAVVAGSASLSTTYKLTAPPPPDSLAVASADRQLLVAFGSDSGDTYTQGVQFFCDPPPNDPDVVPNGDPEPVCSPSVELVPGTSGVSLQHLRCGEAPASSGRGVVSGLVNDVLYNVAAASVDTFGNVGALSLVACGQPKAKPATDTRASACSFAVPAPARPALAFVGLVALGAGLARRRRHG